MGENSAMDHALIIPKIRYQQKKLHVGGISKRTSKEDLLDTFSKYGNIAGIFFSRKCFSFIKFTRGEDAQKVIEAVSESAIELHGKILSVSIARPKNKKKKKKSTGKVEITEQPILIDMLNDDCLIQIFSYLPLQQKFEIEAVCVRWRDVGKRAWHDIRKLKFDSKSVSGHKLSNRKFIEKVLARCVSLNTLELDCVCSSSILRVIRKHCNNLRTIQLDFGTNLYYEKHASNFLKMKKLESFSLKNITSRFLIKSLLNLPETVKSINIIGQIELGSRRILLIFPSYISSMFLQAFDKFNALDSLRIESYLVEKQTIEDMIIKMQTITKLILRSCEFTEGLNLLTNLRNLQHLDLNEVNDVNDDFLVCLSTKCKKLKYLDVSNCKQLTNRGFRELKNLDNLEVLLINDMGDGVIGTSLSEFKNMKKLECRNCSEVNDSVIMRLIENCQNLEHLDVSGTSISEQTLYLATRVTRNRRNSVILFLIVDIDRINFDPMNEEYSPFLRINKTFGSDGKLTNTM